MVPLVLLLYIAQGIEGAAFIKFVDRHQVGKIKHVDLLKLAGCSIFRGHHIEGHIAVIDDFGVGLPDT